MSINYRMMDESCLLPMCLHGGPIALSSPDAVMTTPTYVEKQEGVEAGSMASFIKELCHLYGSCATLALDGDLIVGKIRFAPMQIDQMLNGICLQMEDYAHKIAKLDLANLPKREELKEQNLKIGCFQIANDYKGQGIVKQMLDETLTWARENNWKKLSASAIRHIPPLLNWSGMASKKALSERGFKVISEKHEPALLEAIESQKQGHHGEDVKKAWEAFSDISDDEAAMIYEMELKL